MIVVNRTQGLCTAETLRVSCGQPGLETFPSVDTLKAHLDNSAPGSAVPAKCTIERQGAHALDSWGLLDVLEAGCFVWLPFTEVDTFSPRSPWSCPQPLTVSSWESKAEGTGYRWAPSRRACPL